MKYVARAIAIGLSIKARCVCGVVVSLCARFSASPVALPLYATTLDCIHQPIIEVKCASGFPECPYILFLCRSFCIVVLRRKRRAEKS